MRKINGVPIESHTDLSSLKGGEVLKWDSSTGKMVWEVEDGGVYRSVWYGGRGVFAGSYASGTSDVIDYITIASTGNATDFGDLSVTRYAIAAVEDGTRGVIGAGRSGGYVNTMDYVTIQSTGNATDFGDATIAVKGRGPASNGTRGVFAGGLDGSNYNVMDYITIANTGNATDFGDLLEVASNIAGMSGD